VHLYDPHTANAPPEPYRSQYDDGTVSGLCDGESAFTDELMGRSLPWLKNNSGKAKELEELITGLKNQTKSRDSLFSVSLFYNERLFSMKFRRDW
jgi:hypothetical protein